MEQATNPSGGIDVCTGVSSKHQDIATVVTVVFDSLVGFVYLAILGVLLFLKAYRRFLSGLVLTLVVVTLLLVVADSLKLMVFESRNGTVVVGHEKMCVAMGFVTQWLSWVGLGLVFWITLHLFLLSTKRAGFSGWKYKAGGAVTLLMAALIFSVVPFIDFGEGMAYGSTGLDCWIRGEVPTNTGHCHWFVTGAVEQYLLWRVPLLLTLMAMSVMTVLTLRTLYKTNNANNTSDSIYTRSSTNSRSLWYHKSQLWLLLVYISAVTVLELAGIATFHATRNLDGWGPVVVAIIVPLLLLLLPAGYIFHPATLRRLQWSELRVAARRWAKKDNSVCTEYEVGPEFSTSETPLVIKGTVTYDISARYKALPDLYSI